MAAASNNDKANAPAPRAGGVQERSPTDLRFTEQAFLMIFWESTLAGRGVGPQCWRCAAAPISAPVCKTPWRAKSLMKIRGLFETK
ncbi:hypothetical protein [Achromobacter deleyi]|uniref:hypothetical protein n=1 Tax=Achromobacter deleyi TaxID=1353891 RepID=UPI00158274B0|nr:hypothetical protein [Achromobacter deleyi]